MPTEEVTFPNVSPVGDSALLIELGETITPEINARVHLLDRMMQENPVKGVQEWVPGYSSLLVLYDPLAVNFDELEGWITECLTASSDEQPQSKREIVIPVHYGGNDGPDLDFVASTHNISIEEVIRKHTEPIYRVAMMGFTPGFPYLMGMDPSLATSRLDTPRTEVPAGSVGIAGGQTGIYPLESPGGWRIIGRTEMKLFNPDHAPHFLLSPGDSIRFASVDAG